MSDDADRAAEEIEQTLQEAISRARQQLKQLSDKQGKCLWCGEAVPPGHRWCSIDCRDDWCRYGEDSGF
jgi:RNA polymerase-binding transcription factor DksA